MFFTKQQIRTPCNRSTIVYQPPKAPPNRIRAKGAQRTSSQREVRNPDTHKSKSPVRRRHMQNAPDQNPKEKQGLSFSTGVSIPRGKSKKGAGPPFWSPEGVGIPKGRGPCERSFPLGRVFDDFLHEQKVIRPGRAGPEIHQIRASAKASALVSARVRRHERFAVRQNLKVNWPQAKRRWPGPRRRGNSFAPELFESGLPQKRQL